MLEAFNNKPLTAATYESRVDVKLTLFKTEKPLLIVAESIAFDNGVFKYKAIKAGILLVLSNPASVNDLVVYPKIVVN